MKKILTIILSVLMLLPLTSCGNNSTPESASPSDTAETTPDAVPSTTPDTTPTTAPDTSNPMPLNGSSYWVAYESEGDNRGYVPEGDDVLTDLTLWSDGTARIREIEDGLWLASDPAEQNLTWTYENDGTLNLYTTYDSDTPYWIGKRTADGIELNRFGGVYLFREEPMPEGGSLYSPAELQGVWLQIGSEVEGDIDASLPHNFNSLVFRTDWDGDGKSLLASSESANYGIFDPDRSYDNRNLTALDQPIYEGCGNDEWSVQIGEESPLNEYGYPSGTDYFVTLLDQNTLLMQRYYSFDNGSIPGVSYQTYKRFLPDASYFPTESNLTDCEFALVRYIDTEGISHTDFSGCPAYTDFRLRLIRNLGRNGSYVFTFRDPDGIDFIGGGNEWIIGDGGTILLRNEDVEEDCYAGAITEYNGTTEIFLWDNAGGVMVLERTESSDWDGYVDTMTDIEGNAFAAPENTLCVLYNQSYGDLTAFPSIRFYEIDNSPEAQYLLVTSTEDGAYFWLDEDGYCREDFGAVDAGESFLIRVDVPESDGYLLQIESYRGEYYYELTQSSVIFDGNWNYLTT